MFSFLRKVNPRLLLLPILGAAFGILIFELFLRVTNIVPMFPALTEKSALLGWEYIPLSSALYKSTEFAVNVKINSQGFRGPSVTIPKPQDVKRVAVLGDSFVAGLQVEEDALLTAKLQELLSQNSQRFEVLNFGVSGYGIDQKYLMLQKRIPKYNPDLVVLFLSTNDINDLRKNAIVSQRDGKVEFKSFPKDTPLRKLAKRWLRKSYIVNLIYVRLIAPQARTQGGAGGPLEVQVARGKESEEINYYLNITEEIIKSANQTALQNGTQLLVVSGADYVQSNPQKYGELPDSDKINVKLANFCKSENIPFIDLLSGFRDKTAQGEILFFPQNQHWNEMGHKLVAQTLAQYIKDNFYLENNFQK